MDKNFLFKSFSWVTLANLITKPLWVLLFILAARILGSEQFGVYTYATSIVIIFSVLIDSGLDYYLIRELTQKGTYSSELFSNINAFRVLVFCIIFFIFLILRFTGIYKTEELIFILLILIFQTITFLVTSLRSFVASQQDFKTFSLMLIFEKLMLIVFGTAILLISDRLLYFLFVMMMANLSTLLYFYLKLKKKFELKIIRPNIKLISALLKKSYFLILLNIFISVYFRVDVLLLQFFIDNKRIIGIYGSIHRIIEMYLLFPTVVMSAAFPIISKFYFSDKEKVLHFIEKLFKFFVIISLYIAFIIAFNSNEINHILFGDDYSGGGTGLKIIIWTIIPLGLNFALGNMLVVVKKEKYSAVSVAFACIISFLANIYLIPKYSFLGACISLVLTESIIFILYTYFVIRFYNFQKIIAVIIQSLITLILSVIIFFLASKLFHLSLLYNILWQTTALLLIFSLTKILSLKDYLEIIKVIKNSDSKV